MQEKKRKKKEYKIQSISNLTSYFSLKVAFIFMCIKFIFRCLTFDLEQFEQKSLFPLAEMKKRCHYRCSHKVSDLNKPPNLSIKLWLITCTDMNEA